MMIGLGYRAPLHEFILSRPHTVTCLELTAEHFFHTRTHPTLHKLRSSFHLFVHGLGLSLGTPGPLDQTRLTSFAQVVAEANPRWISEHVAFTRTANEDLGHLNAIPLTPASLQTMIDHVREVSDHCQKPMIVENITTHVRAGGDLKETDFLNQLCERADCGLLLDATNLLINSKNHHFDPTDWLHRIEPERIVQLHLVGYSRDGDRWTDDHDTSIQSEVLELAKAILDWAPVQALILERDSRFPGAEEMQSELRKLEQLWTSRCKAAHAK